MSVYHLSVYHNAAAHTCSQCNHNEVSHSSGHTVSHLTQCRCIGIVGHGYRQSEPLLQHIGQRHTSLPRQVRCLFNGTRIEIRVGRSHSYSTYIRTAHRFVYHLSKAFGQRIGIHVSLNKISCLHAVLRHNVSASIHNTPNRICPADVNSCGMAAFCFQFHHLSVVFAF